MEHSHLDDDTSGPQQQQRPANKRTPVLPAAETEAPGGPTSMKKHRAEQRHDDAADEASDDERPVLERMQQQHAQEVGSLQQRLKDQETAHQQQLRDLAAQHKADMAELREAKQLLVQAGSQGDLADVLPVHVLCEATEAEIQEALDRGGRCTFQWDYRTAVIAVDDAI